MFVAIEGPDAAGKATQADLLKLWFEQVGEQEVSLYSFPRYETRLGHVIRQHLRGEIRLEQVKGEGWGGPVAADSQVFQCMMLADKCDAAVAIKSDLSMGRVVIADRWKDSALTYGLDDDLPGEWLRNIHSTLPRPDLNVLLKVDTDKVALRRPDEPRDRYEKNRGKQLRVMQLYVELWEHMVHTSISPPSWAIIDGMAEKEVVHQSVLAALDQCRH